MESFEQLLANDGHYQPYPISDPKESIAALQYTGGTTGRPKGAMLTHANLSAACNQVLETIDGDPAVLEEGTERVLAALPPFHIYALTANILFGIRIGAELILHPRFELEPIINDLVSKKITVFPACRPCSRRSSAIRVSVRSICLLSSTVTQAVRRCRSSCINNSSA